MHRYPQYTFNTRVQMFPADRLSPTGKKNNALKGNARVTLTSPAEHQILLGSTPQQPEAKHPHRQQAEL